MCWVQAFEADGKCADRVELFARAAERNGLELSRVARCISLERRLECSRINLAAPIVRQAARVGADIVLVTLLIAVGRMREDRRVAIGLGRGDAELKGTFAKRFITGSRSFPGWCRQFFFFFVTGECRKARRGEQRRAADHT